MISKRRLYGAFTVLNLPAYLICYCNPVFRFSFFVFHFTSCLSQLTFFFSRFTQLYFNMKKTFSVILKIFGIIFISLAVVFGWASFNSFMERINHGSGLMFADAEIFTILFLIFLVAGIFCFWIEKKFSFPKK